MPAAHRALVPDPHPAAAKAATARPPHFERSGAYFPSTRYMSREAARGADVAIVYLNEDQDAELTQAAVETEGQRCITIAGDDLLIAGSTSFDANDAALSAIMAECSALAEARLSMTAAE